MKVDILLGEPPTIRDIQVTGHNIEIQGAIEGFLPTIRDVELDVLPPDGMRFRYAEIDYVLGAVELVLVDDGRRGKYVLMFRPV